jgi:hypothetical protein
MSAQRAEQLGAANVFLSAKRRRDRFAEKFRHHI